MTDNPRDDSYTDWTDDEMESFASINAAALADAKAAARRDEELAALLEAQQVNDE